MSVYDGSASVWLLQGDTHEEYETCSWVVAAFLAEADARTALARIAAEIAALPEAPPPSRLDGESNWEAYERWLDNAKAVLKPFDQEWNGEAVYTVRRIT